MFYAKRKEKNGSTTLFKMASKPSFKVTEITEAEYNKLKEELYPEPEITEDVVEEPTTSESAESEPVKSDEIEYTDTLQDEDGGKV